MRRKRLGWIIDGEMYLWVGIPLLWRLGRRAAERDLWRAQRPEGGFFRRPVPGVNLVGRDGVFRRYPGFAVTLASQRPGLFFLRVPSKLFAPRTFGYRFLRESDEQQKAFLSTINRLDLETIDLP